MKKVIRLLVLSILGLSVITSTVYASSHRGKAFYAGTLKEPCGFDGSVMGKKYTINEWRVFYNDKKLGAIVHTLCPKAPEITDEKDLTNLYHFLSSFASDSGNVPSCN